MKANAQKKIATSKVTLFKDTMAGLAKAFPQGITRGQASTTSAVLYEALSVGLAEAIRLGGTPKIERLSSLVTDSMLRKLTTGATNSNRMLTGRIEYVTQKLTA